MIEQEIKQLSNQNEICPCSDDFVSSYFVAFSNDTREWTVLHDGYAEWVIRFIYLSAHDVIMWV